MGGNNGAGGVNLKLLIDKERNKVLFAEAGKEFVDFLFHILALPVGVIAKLLTKADMIGSVGNLYESIENLGDSYMKESLKKNLLEPKTSGYGGGAQTLLSLQPHDDTSSSSSSSSTQTKRYYRCDSNNISYGSNCSGGYMSETTSATCPICFRQMTTELKVVTNPNKKVEAVPAAGYVNEGVITYMVMDDLTLKPMSAISCIALLTRFCVKDIGNLEEMEIDVGMAEAVKLMKASLQSQTVLTDVFLSCSLQKK